MQDKTWLLSRARNSQKHGMAHGDMGKGYHPIWRWRERSWDCREPLCPAWEHAGTSWSCGSNADVVAHGLAKLPHTGTFIWFSFLKRRLFAQKSRFFIFLRGGLNKAWESSQKIPCKELLLKQNTFMKNGLSVPGQMLGIAERSVDIRSPWEPAEDGFQEPLEPQTPPARGDGRSVSVPHGAQQGQELPVRG